MNQEQKKKRRYSWWPYIREVVREYPKKNEAGKACAVAEREDDAVQEALEETERMADGQNRLKLIRLLHWDRTHTLDGAALAIPCSRRTAAYWQREFFELVARNRGLLD